MAMTQTLYYEDTYADQADARVLEVRPHGKQSAIILDRTVCYPEGGGQSGDRGMIANEPLLDTIHGDDGEILHIVAAPTALKAGMDVHVTIDWEHRYHYMCQHTAQHLISATLFSAFGIGTVSVHQGEDVLTVETDRSDIPMQTLLEVERLVNHAICENVPVSYKETSHEEAQAIGLRRSIKVEGDVRLVTIEGHDIIACGGIHVAHSGEAGLVLLVGTEMIRSHVRTIWKTGAQAMRTIHQDRDVVTQVGAILSAQSHEIVAGVQRISQNLVDMKARYENVASRLASALLLQAVSLSKNEGGVHIVALDATEQPDVPMKAFAEHAPSLQDVALCVIQRSEGRTAWMVVLVGAATHVHFDDVRSRLLVPHAAKGGGKAPVWQGIVPTEVGSEFLHAFEETVKELMHP